MANEANIADHLLTMRKHVLRLAEEANERDEPAMVYFIAPIEGGPVKIGTTKNINQRLATIQSSSPLPLHLISCAPGDRDLETSLHAMFHTERLHGEWFEPSNWLLGVAAEFADRWTG